MNVIDNNVGNMLKVKIDDGATEIDKIGHHIITYKDGSQIEYAPKKIGEKELSTPLRRTLAGQGPCTDFCQDRGTF